MVYTKAPDVSCNDIAQALKQCEILSHTAEFYRALDAVRPYLTSALSQHRSELYAAIAKDPPRWLMLSSALESRAIFDEALIHCAGGFPDFPWPTSLTKLPPKVLKVIFNKATKLESWCNRIDLALLTNTLKELNHDDVSLDFSTES